MENEKLNNLLKTQKILVQKGDYQESLNKCCEIIQKIISFPKEKQYEILSSILSQKNQFLYIIFGIYQYLIQNQFILNSDNQTKIKYYELLLTTLKKNKDKSLEFQTDKENLISNLEKENYNIEEIEKIINLISLYPIENNRFNTINNNNSKLYNEEILITNGSKNSYIMLSDQSLMTQNFSSPMVKNGNSFNLEGRKEKNNKLTNMKDKNKNENLSKKYKPNRNLPYIIINFVANFNSKQIIEKIENLMNEINFNLLCKIKDNQFENIKVFEYKDKNCLKIIYKKLCLKNKENLQFYITTILKRDENDFSSGLNSFVRDKYERTLIIKTIKGNEKESKNQIIRILKHFSLLSSKIKIIQKSKAFINLNLENYVKQYIIRKKADLFKEKNLPFNTDYNITFQFTTSKRKLNDLKYNEFIDEESFIEKSNNNAGKTLEVYKLLSEKNYGLGKTMSLFIENFKNDYNNINNIPETIETNEIMKKIVKVTEDCVSTFNSSYNLNDEYSNLNFRESTEQFLWNKIYFILFEIYKKKFNEQNKKFLERQKEIKNNFNIDEIFKHLDINDKFRGEDEEPFKITIELINKVEYEQVPKKKFETLTQSALELRNSILDYTKGKIELESMDDELPICMYLVTQIKVSNFLAELNLIQDYLQYTLRDKMIQNKVVTNLISSVLYITDSW